MLAYSVHGGLENWGNGSSWTTQAKVCTPYTLRGYTSSKTAIGRRTMRTATNLVENGKQRCDGRRDRLSERVRNPQHNDIRHKVKEDGLPTASRGQTYDHLI